MRVIPLAAESLGVRSMATYVEAGDLGILIDPGATLAPTRWGLPPAEALAPAGWRRRAVGVASAAPRRRRHAARSRRGTGRVRPRAARALRVRLRRAGTALGGGGGVADPAAADAALSLGAAVLRRARPAG